MLVLLSSQSPALFCIEIKQTLKRPLKKPTKLINYLPYTLMGRKISWDNNSSVYSTYLSKKFGHFGINLFKEAYKDKVRLSLSMTSNIENPFQTTAKTSSSSQYLEFTILLYKYGLPYLPTYHKNFCPNFFFGKSMAGGYPTYLQFGHMSKVS